MSASQEIFGLADEKLNVVDDKLIACGSCGARKGGPV